MIIHNTVITQVAPKLWASVARISVASVMAINIYPTAINKTRIQRVADVMFQFGLLKSRFVVTPMIGP